MMLLASSLRRVGVAGIASPVARLQAGHVGGACAGSASRLGTAIRCPSTTRVCGGFSLRPASGLNVDSTQRRHMSAPVSGTMNGLPWYNGLVSSAARPHDFQGMDLHIVGSAASCPSKHRNVSCSVLRLPRRVWMFDCGEGTQRQLLSSATLRYGTVQRIFLTHLHGDHIYGLPGLLCSMLAPWLQDAGLAAEAGMVDPMSSGGSGTGGKPAAKSNNTLHVYGPKGLFRFMSATLGYFFGGGAPPRGTGRSRAPPLAVHELLHPGERPSMATEPLCTAYSHASCIFPNDDGVWDLAYDDGCRALACPILHSVQCFGYVVQEDDRPGTIDVEKASAMGLLPGREYAELKRGRSVPLPSGGVIRPEDVLGPTKKGRKLVVLGDTYDPMRIAPWAEGADLLVHEATFAEGTRAYAKERGHSTAKMAGEFAAIVGAKRLLLNHFSNSFASAYGEASVSALRTPDVLHDVRSNSGRKVDRRRGSSSGKNATRHPFPNMTDTSGMRDVVMRAQDASGLDKVAASRDFMVFPIPPTDSK